MKELLAKYVKPFWKRISIGFIIKFIGTTMDLFIPWTLAYIIDRITPTKNLWAVALLGMAMLAMAVCGLTFNVAANWNAGFVTKNIVANIRRDLFSAILYLDRRKTDGFAVPSLISRCTSDSYNVHSMIGMIQRIGIRAPILLLGGIAVTFLTDASLALILLALQPLIFLTVVIISKRGLPLFSDVQLQIEKIVLAMRENISGVRIIKALDKTEHERKRFAKINEELVSKEKKSANLMAMTNPLVTLYLNIGLALVVLVGAFRVSAGKTEVGVIIAFLSYFIMIVNSMYAISRIFIVSTKGIASYSRISEVLNTAPELKIEEIPAEHSEYHIEFKEVSFSYYKNKNNLTDISFKLKRGQTLGIIGPTGSGKSTVIRLLMRFYDVSTGSITIDGRDVRSIPFEELYRKFGIVFQDDVLFADTIAENISLGRSISEDELWRSVCLSEASEFVSEFDDHMEHQLTIKGSNLSGGQKQRLLISRALASKPEILILDDSSSALDYTTDQKLRNNIAGNFSDSTTIIVAQRISSIKDSDLIIMMEDGFIAAIGTHEELLAQSEAYRHISDMQLNI